MEEYQYEAICDVCDTEQQISIRNEDERPGFCAMCGEQLEWEGEEH